LENRKIGKFVETARSRLPFDPFDKLRAGKLRTRKVTPAREIPSSDL
jgi:hypothetical protein